MKCDICGKEVKNLGSHKYQAHEKPEIPIYDPRLKENILFRDIWFDFYVGTISVEDNGLIKKDTKIKRECQLTMTIKHDIIDRHIRIELHNQLDKVINESNKYMERILGERRKKE